MRSYIKGFYGVFREDSDNLGLHLTLRIWRHTSAEFDSVIEQLREDVKAAGGDWTGTLQSKQKMYFDFDSNDEMQNMLKIYFHGTAQASGAFDDWLFDRLTDIDPRGPEKPRFKLVPLEK